jgi:hypothetical protein
MRPSPEQLQAMIEATEYEDGTSAPVELVRSLARRGWATFERGINYFKTSHANFVLSQDGLEQVQLWAYGCMGCGEFTTGTVSPVREYACCPNCVDRETERRGAREEDDDDPGPFLPRPYAPAEILNLEFPTINGGIKK